MLATAPLVRSRVKKAIDAYVADVEAKLPNLSRSEKILAAGRSEGRDGVEFEKLHGYYDGQILNG